MDPTVQHANSCAIVYDLAAISAPARRVIELYDRVIAGTPLARGELDDALEELHGTPRPRGRLGNDIDLVTRGGHGTTRGALLEAIERLRRVAAVQSNPAPTVALRAPLSTRRRGRRHIVVRGQEPLPGIDNPLTPGATP